MCMSRKTKNSKLLNQPYKLGDLQLKNRFVMAPLTRCRADKEDQIPNDLMLEYYTQRATFGLIITECAQVSDIGTAFPGSGAIFNKKQADGWRKIVDGVHEKGAKIIMQVWHAGRAVPNEFIQGRNPISSSAVPIRENNEFTQKPHPVPKEMTKEDIKQVIEQFRQSAVWAKEVGFDGIQLHGANGYLVDQFIRDGVNKRTDEYGGCFENRARFLLEVIDALISVFGNNRTSVRLSPTGRFNDMYDSYPFDLYKYILGELEKKNLHFVEMKRHGIYESMKYGDQKEKFDKEGRLFPKHQIPDFYKAFRPCYKGIMMGNDSYDPYTAEEAIKKGEVDIISFGRLAINNPDLPERYEKGVEINSKYDFATFYAGGEKGYVDFLTYEQQQQSQKKQV